MPHATSRLWPITTPGTPGTPAPIASRLPPERWTTWNMPGTAARRCGSLASSGAPLAVREPATAHALEAPPAGAPASAKPR